MTRRNHPILNPRRQQGMCSGYPRCQRGVGCAELREVLDVEGFQNQIRNASGIRHEPYVGCVRGSVRPIVSICGLSSHRDDAGYGLCRTAERCDRVTELIIDEPRCVCTRCCAASRQLGRSWHESSTYPSPIRQASLERNHYRRHMAMQNGISEKPAGIGGR
jgi:hypothetical protein